MPAIWNDGMLEHRNDVPKQFDCFPIFKCSIIPIVSEAN